MRERERARERERERECHIRWEPIQSVIFKYTLKKIRHPSKYKWLGEGESYKESEIHLQKPTVLF